MNPSQNASSDDYAATLPRSSPEAQGLSSSAIEEFVRAANQQIDAMHSFMLLRHGHVVTEAWWPPHTATMPHVLWSLSKSFTSTAVGLVADEGKLDIDDPILDFFPEFAPDRPGANLQAMRVRDLLTMTTGHDTHPALESSTPWERCFLEHPVLHAPGTHFLYNNAASYMLSALVQKLTGQTTLDYLRPRLFAPLGVTDPQWDSNQYGITLGGWGLHLRTEEVARFGQLYLQKGQWHGQQLVPKAWVEAAISRQVSNGDDPASDWAQGYGFQFWQCRYGAYRADGKDGQFCVVLPQQDAVVVMTAQTGAMREQLALVWDKLLPAFQETPLAADEEAEAQLKRMLAEL